MLIKKYNFIDLDQINEVTEEFTEKNGIIRSSCKVLQPQKFGVKCFAFLATAAIVATMLAANIPVRSHPLYSHQYVVPANKISSTTLHDLMGDKNFIFLSTVSFLTTTGSNQTYTSDAAWNNSSNSVECVGPGGSGAANKKESTQGQQAGGGGGGAYSKITNFTFATPGTTTATYRVGSGGGATSTTTGSSASHVDGAAGLQATWFNASADPGVGSDNSKCSAAPGGAGINGVAGVSLSTGGAGGATTSSWGTSKTNGGRGGQATSGTSVVASGGGGAGGPNGDGVQGGDTSAGVVTAGGNGDAGSGGAGGGSTGATGSPGLELGDLSKGCGGGGGGISATTNGTTTAGTGGLYGGGGGGARNGGSGNSSSAKAVSGAGQQGLIVLSWTPSSSNSLAAQFMCPTYF
jgi:hypothetical protein